MEACKPGSESANVPSRSKNSQRTLVTASISDTVGLGSHSLRLAAARTSLAVQHRPALFQHFDALGVLILDMPIVIALVQQPQHLEVTHQQPIADLRLVGRLRVEARLARLKRVKCSATNCRSTGIESLETPPPTTRSRPSSLHFAAVFITYPVTSSLLISSRLSPAESENPPAQSNPRHSSAALVAAAISSKCQTQ